MLNCRQVSELCSQELERPLGMGERLALRVHILMCPGCANFRKQMTLLRQVTRAYATGEAPGEVMDDSDRPADPTARR